MTYDLDARYQAEKALRVRVERDGHAVTYDVGIANCVIGWLHRAGWKLQVRYNAAVTPYETTIKVLERPPVKKRA